MKLILEGGTLFDGTGQTPIADATVMVADQLIVFAGPSSEASLPEGETRRYDTTGMTVMPGMIDSHLHLFTEFGMDGTLEEKFANDSDEMRAIRVVRRARENLEAGFTTVRDVWIKTSVVVAARQAIAEGEFIGARIVTSGCFLTITGGPWDGHPMGMVVDGPDEARKAVRTLVREGVDLIKVMGTRTLSSANFPDGGTFTDEELEAIVSEAHRAGKMVAAHAHTDTAGLKQLVKAGVDTIEHGGHADEESVRLMARQGTILVPTLKAVHAHKDVPAARTALEGMINTIKMAQAAGVTIAMGTDHADVHGRSAVELQYLVEAGLTSMQALVAATQGGSKACGMADKIGTLKPGKLADIIVVDGNPLADVTILQDLSRILLVIKEGQVVVSRGL